MDRLGRKAAIDRLVDHTLESIHQDPDGEMLRAILRNGFRGFERLSGPSLEAELNMRGLRVDSDLRGVEEDTELDSMDGPEGELARDLGEMVVPSHFRTTVLEDAD
jgi:hypothetical protein